MPVEFVVGGLIGDRWQQLGAAGGAFGPAVGPEEDVPGRRGRRQRFERGEIGWSPDQEMIVSVYRLRNEACFEWSRTRFEYEFFRYDIKYNGVGQGQAAFELRGTSQIWTRLQGFGEYAFTVKGCFNPTGGSEESPQGETIPVRLQLEMSAGVPNPADPPVGGLIGERWHELGAWDGPLGRPIVGEFGSPTVGIRSQRFENGWISTAPGFGPRMVVAVYVRGRSIEVNWGGADTNYNAFRVDVRFQGTLLQQALVWPFVFSEFARPGIGSGFFRLDSPKDGFYEFFIHPTITSSPFPDPEESFPFGSTPDLGVFFIPGPADTHLDPPAANGTPAHAFASLDPRASAVARQYARSKPLRVAFTHPDPGKPGDEGDPLQLIAHLQAISEDHDFSVPGELPSRVLVHIRLRQLAPGEVGTLGDYDFFLKGLMALLYRYRHLLTDDALDFILRDLVPAEVTGPLDLAELITYEPVPGAQIASETENHVAMIASSQYLVNQVLLERFPGDERYNNNTNGMTAFLLRFMQDIAKRDFLEFNSRPYSRMTFHALLNLHEFALDEPVKTGAHILLDYLTVKFAVSSNRRRRIAPFRRLLENTNSFDGELNDLLFNHGNDPMIGFFLTYCGPVDRDGNPTAWFPDGWADHAVIAGLATYRPPSAAYILAMTEYPAVQHRFYHGPRHWAISVDTADGGVETYYRSPSFLLTAGGMFLNSGMGFDDSPFTHFKDTAIAQSTTLIPTRADVKFEDLIWLSPGAVGRVAVNTAVYRGFACGANLFINDRWLPLTGTPREGPWYVLNFDRDMRGFGRLGYYVAAYGTLVTEDPPEIDPAAVRLKNLGFFYAVEAANLDFDAFKNSIMENNTAIPAPLQYGGTYTFNTHDGHSFTFKLSVAGDKYASRILAMDGNQLVQDLRSLPLVEGDYMSAPGGHDGLVNITHPECAAPLVLDFRNQKHPVRHSNGTACPGPLFDRAQAIHGVANQHMALSSQLSVAGKLAEAVTKAHMAVSVMRGFDPPPQALLTHRKILAQALHTLALQMVAAGRNQDARGSAREAIQAYRQVAVTAGADVASVGSQLLSFSSQLDGAGLEAESIAAVQAAADLLRNASPPPQGLLMHRKVLAQALHTLALQMVAAGHIGEGRALAHEAIQAYRNIAATPDADLATVGSQLLSFSSQLDGAGLEAESIAAAQAAADLLRNADPVDRA